ncbi:hypothetical protein LD13_gp242 [Bacillus phage Bobb]|uniref:Uncharacterized protein n=1 Tax=Bacillus phage Bobb TaxID=1527469 RepID=A0A076G723_9CAUD|nr:hypothetical protein LD13_gp242 [Bacillus phage Bobb]AII28107.1 hypothetical protein [Bacillus phage Bobb]
MAKKVSKIEIKLLNDAVYYVDPAIVPSFSVPERPEAFIWNCIVGSRSGLLKVYSSVELTGATKYVNPQMIVEVVVGYE